MLQEVIQMLKESLDFTLTHLKDCLFCWINPKWACSCCCFYCFCLFVFPFLLYYSQAKTRRRKGKVSCVKPFFRKVFLHFKKLKGFIPYSTTVKRIFILGFLLTYGNSLSELWGRVYSWISFVFALMITAIKVWMSKLKTERKYTDFGLFQAPL